MQPLDPEKSPKVGPATASCSITSTSMRSTSHPAAAPLQVHVPALNHIGLWVDDIHVAVDWLSENGVRFAPGGIRKGAAGHDVTFIHPKGNEASPISGAGILVELVQAPENVIAAYDTIAAAEK